MASSRSARSAHAGLVSSTGRRLRPTQGQRPPGRPAYGHSQPERDEPVQEHRRDRGVLGAPEGDQGDRQAALDHAEPAGRDGQDGGQLTGAVGEEQPAPRHAGPDGQERERQTAAVGHPVAQAHAPWPRPSRSGLGADGADPAQPALDDLLGGHGRRRAADPPLRQPDGPGHVRKEPGPLGPGQRSAGAATITMPRITSTRSRALPAPRASPSPTAASADRVMNDSAFAATSVHPARTSSAPKRRYWRNT